MDSIGNVPQSPTSNYSFDTSSNHASNYDDPDWLDRIFSAETQDLSPYSNLLFPDEVSRSTTPNPPLHGREQETRRNPPHPKAVRKLLVDSYNDHISNPYLDDHGLSDLSKKSGCTPKQIRTFFMNRRYRSTQTSTSGLQLSNNKSDVNDSEIPKTDESQHSRKSENTSTHGYSRLEDNCSNPIVEDNNAYWLTLCREGIQRGYEPTEHLLETQSHFTVFPDSGAWSSAVSVTNAANHITISRRKGKRRYPISVPSMVAKNEKTKIYQCTFCGLNEFSDKYGWRRHEESLHYPQSAWICGLDCPISLTDNGPECIMCRIPNPSSEHLMGHNYLYCAGKSISQRTFPRKDGFVKHMRRIHHMTQWKAHMGGWKRSVSRSLRFTCGFCGIKLDGWKLRVDHIAVHFEDGLSLKDWIFRSEPEQLDYLLPETQGRDLDNSTRSLSVSLAEIKPSSQDGRSDKETEDQGGEMQIPGSIILDNDSCTQDFTPQNFQSAKEDRLNQWLAEQLAGSYLARLPSIFPNFSNPEVCSSEIDGVRSDYTNLTPPESCFSCSDTNIRVSASDTNTRVSASAEDPESLEFYEAPYHLLKDHLASTGAWIRDPPTELHSFKQNPFVISALTEDSEKIELEVRTKRDFEDLEKIESGVTKSDFENLAAFSKSEDLGPGNISGQSKLYPSSSCSSILFAEMEVRTAPSPGWVSDGLIKIKKMARLAAQIRGIFGL
ncbi:hypothetical protein AOQ84DRAFT_437522 [Glonium stellatum]|uniref:Homeobox domain-containing protein n=1 Tax=Glonium stellatum TaxID=574774 RepID=A0A8E2F6X7_9PEZI|nr:hypothetical protein AOQ84DRAFT_437522 [Glonium stellatum]